MRGAWGACSARATQNGCDRWSVSQRTAARLVPPPGGNATRVCIFPDDIRLTCRRMRAGGSVVEPRGVRRVQRDIPCAVVQHAAHAHGASKPRRSSNPALVILPLLRTPTCARRHALSNEPSYASIHPQTATLRPFKYFCRMSGMRGAWGPCSARATRNGCDRWRVPQQTTAHLVRPPGGDATRV